MSPIMKLAAHQTGTIRGMLMNEMKVVMAGVLV